jgi:hypothetical protein
VRHLPTPILSAFPWAPHPSVAFPSGIDLPPAAFPRLVAPIFTTNFSAVQQLCRLAAGKVFAGFCQVGSWIPWPWSSDSDVRVCLPRCSLGIICLLVLAPPTALLAGALVLDMPASLQSCCSHQLGSSGLVSQVESYKEGCFFSVV